jgi:hypothetical protein
MKTGLIASLFFISLSISSFGQLPYELPNTEVQLQQLVKEIKENPIPHNNTQLERELDDIERVISHCFEVQNDSSEQMTSEQQLAELNNLKKIFTDQAKPIRELISKLGPGKPIPPETAKAIENIYNKTLEVVYNCRCPNLSSFSDQLAQFVDSNVNLTEDDVSNLKAKLTQDYLSQIIAEIDKARSEAQSSINTTQLKMKYAEQVEHALKERKKRIGEILDSNQFSNTDSKDNFLRSQLVWFIIILAFFGIGAMAVVRLFSPAMQEEWVASGQVIQFVTVMILLIIILCLALLGVVGEETIGTLLGGIGGYVLSQGIGRAATRATQQAILTQPPHSPSPLPGGGQAIQTNSGNTPQTTQN